LFFDRRLTLRKTLSARKRLKKDKKTGNQACFLKSSALSPTKIPESENTKTMIMKMIRAQHVKLESYQGVMAFLKKGFGSNCI
jgi:hypothetical protein